MDFEFRGVDETQRHDGDRGFNMVAIEIQISRRGTIIPNNTVSCVYNHVKILKYESANLLELFNRMEKLENFYFQE
jgi:hypothetical protein